VFENKVLRRIFGPRGEEVTENMRTLYNEELCNLYPLPSITRVIKLRRMKHGSCSTHGRDEKYIQNSGQKTDGRDCLEDLGTVGQIILEWILKKLVARIMGCIHLTQDRD
jgi:hypothetical protein